MNVKSAVLAYILLSSSICCAEEEEEEEYKRPNVPECPYEYKDGMYICPNVTQGGAIPKLMQCANKMKHDFMGFCKSETYPEKQLSTS